MKLIMENWKRFLNEQEEPAAQVQQILQGNQYLSHLADKVTPDTVKDLKNLYYVQFPGELGSDHIKKHFDKSNPGSSWAVPEQKVSDLILKVLSTPPTKQVEERGTTKYKWLNIPAGAQVGHDSLKKLDPSDPSISVSTDLERFGMVDRVKDWDAVSGVAEQNNYELVTQEGKPYTKEHLAADVPAFIKQDIGVIPGDKMQNPTDKVNVIAAQVGEVNGKPVLTLMTVFPGNSPVDAEGNDIMNKKDFKDHGYYFIKGK